MPINRESQITVLRSIGGSIPDGLTFGEFGFAGANRQLFIGGTGGGASVESIWIGASITGTDIVGVNGSGIWPNGYDSQYTLSTTKAVKKYIDDAVGTAGVVTSVNGNIGAITITGAGNNAAVVVRQGVLNGPHNIDARIATNTGITGVASFSSASFNVGTTGVVTLKNPSTSFGVQGNSGGKVNVTLGANLTLTGSGSIRTVATQDFNGDGVDVVFDTRVATSSLTGVASFDPRHFAIGLSGHVSLTGSFSVTGDTVVAGNSISVSRSNNQATITNAGVTSIAFGNATLTGNVSLTSGSNVTMTVVGNQVTIATSGGGATTSALNTWTQTQTFNGGIQTTGLTATNGLSASGLVYFTNGLTAPGGIHTTGLTATTAVFNGLATFNSGLTTTGLATFSNGLTAPGGIHTRGLTAFNIVGTNASFSGGVTFSGTPVFSSGLSATGITANTIFANNATFTNATFTNDVTVTGNLTVDGTVITANVETILIEDPLIKLAKNNTANSVDIGFYGQYQGLNTDLRFTGLFRDADADGKYRLFTGLTAGVGFEPTTTVNTNGAGYTVATLIAKLDGGTF